MSVWEYEAPTTFLASVPLPEAAELERQKGDVDLEDRSVPRHVKDSVTSTLYDL
jgi:hypothetical protein